MTESKPLTADSRAMEMDRDALVRAILALEKGRPEKLTDSALAYQLAHHLKPYIDRLAAGEDGDFTLDALAGEVDLSEELASEDNQADLRRPPPAAVSLDGPVPELVDLPPQDKARWLFMERFIPLEQLESILGYSLDTDDFAAYLEELDGILENLLLLPQTTTLAEANDIPALQKVFATSLLLFRNPFIGDGSRNPIPCTLDNLRQFFPTYFYKRRKTPNWYERYEFYSEPLGRPHWVMCEIEYLNCTLRRPERKLSAHARHWHLPSEYAQQKNVLEDIYDRILCGEALKEDLFEQNCNCITSTTYRNRGKGPLRMVYTVQRHRKIAIHGKAGTPHWRTSRRLWPGIFPTVVFP